MKTFIAMLSLIASLTSIQALATIQYFEKNTNPYEPGVGFGTGLSIIKEADTLETLKTTSSNENPPELGEKPKASTHFYIGYRSVPGGRMNGFFAMFSEASEAREVLEHFRQSGIHDTLLTWFKWTPAVP